MDLLTVGGFLLSLIAFGLAGGAMLFATSAQRKVYNFEHEHEQERQRQEEEDEDGGERGDSGGDR